MRSHTRRRRPKRSRFRLFWLLFQITTLLTIAIILGVIGGVFWSVSKMLPEDMDISQYKPTEATKILSSDGVVLAELYEENREFVSLNEIPNDLQNATVAIEDFRFYKHPGVDIVGIGRAVYQNLRTGRMGQGGSTLTQQLARNIYLTQEKKLSRKLQEIALAIQLERHKTKQEILELYLNQVYYGSGSYGVQTASKIYFGKNVRDLTLAESALIAGLPQKPSGYSPYEHLNAATGRRNVVLNRMAVLGYITPNQRDEALKEKVNLVGQKPSGIAKYKAPWFVTHVIKELSSKYEDLLYSGGLRIYTTLNYEMQEVAEKALREGVKENSYLRISQGALICIDPHTGYIKAMVGSVNPDFTKDQFNRATQAKRQPGSAFKAFVYTAAIDNGYEPTYRLSNAKITFKGYGGKDWTPRNYNDSYGGTYTIATAVAKSINVCAVRMADEIGIDEVIKYAKLLGIKSPLDRTLSLALGASVVTPIEICSAYGVFAADGLRCEPMSVVKITEANTQDQDESLIEENGYRGTQVLSEETAGIMNDIFRGVVTRGTGTRAGRVPNAHGKTGTTSSDRSAWFVGYTPELVTAVWVGNDDNSPMRGVYGGNVCAPIWSDFMSKAVRVRKKEKEAEKSGDELTYTEKSVSSENTRRRPEPESQNNPEKIMLAICSESGLVAVSGCTKTYQVPYDKGTEPHTLCNLHSGGTLENTTTHTPPPAVPDQEATNDNRPNSYGSSRTSNNTTGTANSNGYVVVTICADSGLIANEYCQETVTKRFRSDESPTRVCRIHRAPPE
ncbi:MAG: transglycosylase domain-containing protein [Armatimonadota bacterium]